MTPFRPGDRVRHRSDPGPIGIVVNVDEDPQFEETTLEVRFPNGLRSDLAERFLPADESAGEPWERLAAGRVGTARALRTLLTTVRLRHPPGPAGASFGAARAQLLPYQFKPLVKFLESPTHSILIADEVGLGKTIEAGYILLEWKRRQAARKLLLVVPSRLRTKWRDELQTRFDERFEIVGTTEILDIHRRVRADEDVTFQCITSYETLRSDAVRAVLDTLPPLDLLLLDEAHRARNRETLTHRAVRTLAAEAAAVVLLTATPVQTSTDDLYAVLSLLRPHDLGRPEDFVVRLHANRPIVRATRHAGEGEPDAAARELAGLRGPLAQEPSLRALIAQLREEPTPVARPRRAELQAAVSDFNELGSLFSRTRKVEVMPDRPLRDARPGAAVGGGGRRLRAPSGGDAPNDRALAHLGRPGRGAHRAPLRRELAARRDSPPPTSLEPRPGRPGRGPARRG